MRNKGVETGKREVEDIPLVESAPRYTAADIAGADIVRIDLAGAGLAEAEQEPARLV